MNINHYKLGELKNCRTEIFSYNSGNKIFVKNYKKYTKTN